MNCDIKPPIRIIYDYKSARKLRRFFIQVLILLDERRENPNKPDYYLDPHWDYDEIEQIIHLLKVSPSQNLDLTSGRTAVSWKFMRQRKNIAILGS